MKWRSVLVFSAILMAGISIGIGLRVLRLEKISTTLQSVVPAPDARAGRAIYPYSLIPGGVRNSFELSESIAHDPVLAEHYRDIRPAAMFPLRLVTDTEGYVSYRVGSHIYWTHHLVRVRKGELVLTDGFRMVRGRCGNQIVPAYLRPKGVPTTLDPMEPPPVVFESGYPPVMNVPPAQALLAEKDAPPFPITPATPGGSTPPFWPPVAPPVAWCCSGSTQTGTPPPVPPVPPTGGGGGDTPVPPSVPPVTAVTAVPEPGTLLMVATGLGLLLFGKKLP